MACQSRWCCHEQCDGPGKQADKRDQRPTELIGQISRRPSTRKGFGDRGMSSRFGWPRRPVIRPVRLPVMPGLTREPGTDEGASASAGRARGFGRPPSQAKRHLLLVAERRRRQRLVGAAVDQMTLRQQRNKALQRRRSDRLAGIHRGGVDLRCLAGAVMQLGKGVVAFAEDDRVRGGIGPHGNAAVAVLGARAGEFPESGSRHRQRRGGI